MKRPIPNSYWVEPGQLLAGEHPDGGSPSRTRERIARFTEAGIRHFFDLTQPGELPDYAPLLPAGSHHHAFPIPDHDVPGSPALMCDILDAMRAARQQGGALYVHCRAGIGRTGTTIGCWLCEQGATGDAALDQLNQLWRENARAAQWPSVPETDAQHRYVQRWPTARMPQPVTMAPVGPGLARYHGCLLGLALGDALANGAQDAALRFTDETGMTICVAESLLACEGFDGRDQIDRYREWQRNPAASGADERASLRPAVRDTLLRALRSHAQLVGSHDPAVVDAAPLARTAAAVLYSGTVHGAGALEPAAALAADVSRVTHQAPLAVDACRLFAALLATVLAGGSRDALRQAAHSLRTLPLKDEVRAVADQWSDASAGAAARRPAGNPILAALDRGVRAFLNHDDFASGVAKLQASPGADPDATLAVYGALAGAREGESGLPGRGLGGLHGRDALRDLAGRLFHAGRARSAAVP